MNRADRRKIAKTDKERVAEYMAAGLSLMEAGGNLHEAQKHYRKVLAVDPGHADANLQLGIIEVWTRNLGKAEQYFTLAYKRNPANSNIVNNLAMSIHEQGRVGQAMPLYEQALKLDPESPAIRVNLAKGLLNAGQLKRAQDEALQGVNLAPDFGMGWFILGTIQHALALREQATESMTKAVHLLPGHMEANFLLTRFLFDPSDPKACLNPSEEVYTNQGDNTEAAMCRAELLYQTGEFKSAIEILEKNLDTKNELLRLSVLNVMAACQQGLGQTDLAVEFHKKAVQLSFDDPSTRFFYGRTLAQTGNFDEAVVQLKKAGARLAISQDYLAYLTFSQKKTEGDERMLRDVQQFLKERMLAPKEIFGSIEELNKAVMIALEKTEQTPVHPLDRNRRVGNSYWEAVLGKADGDATVILGEMIQDAVVSYLADIPQEAANHPFAARLKFGLGTTGSWAESVSNFEDFSFSIDKFGWFKAIYFVSVPVECGDETTKDGWLRFGVPEFGSSKEFAPDYEVKPEAGKLVIFPAYYWHGFNALKSSEQLTYIGVQGHSRAG